MTGNCPYCGGVWSTDPQRRTFSACCGEMADELDDMLADAEDRDNDRVKDFVAGILEHLW